MEAISVGPWGCEEGTPFSHHINNGRIQNLVIVYEGGFKSLTINKPTATTKNHQHTTVIEPQIPPTSIIRNSNFRQPIGANWTKEFYDCTVDVISGSTGVECDNANYVIVSKRKNSETGIKHDITGEVCAGGVYEILTNVSVKGGNGKKFEICANVKIENMNKSLSSKQVGSVCVKNGKWKKLDCWFNLNKVPKSVLFCIDGPPPEIDLCIGSVSILPVTRQFVVNLDPDEYFTGITGYFRKIQNGMSEVISSLTFLTNRTKYGPYGPEKGTFFSSKTRNGEIIGFYGTSSGYFNSIGCHIKPCGFCTPDVNA